MTFEEFEDILRISWEPEVWGPWVPFVHFLDFLRTFWTLWGILEDLRTWFSQNVEESFRNFWWLLVNLLRPDAFEDFNDFSGHWGFCEPDYLLRTLRTLINFWGLWNRLEYLLWTYEDFEGFDNLLRNLRTFWGSVENLRSEDLGYLLCIFLTFWGLSGPFEEFWKTWGPDFLRTLKNLSGTFDDFLWTYWGPDAFEDYNDFSGHWGFCEPDYLLRTLRTLINFWGLWNRLEYVLWTYEDFEGFDNLLRNLRPFWGSVENLRSEDLGYLLCIFLTFWGLCGPFEDFLKTWGPDALRTLKNLSGTFDDFLWTIWGLFLGNFEDFLRTIWGTFDDHRILTTLITSWGLWCRLEYLLWTSEDFEGFDDLLRNLRTFWGSVENLRSEDLGYLLCIFLTFWGLCWTFWGLFKDLRTWCSQNIEEPFWNFWWLLVDHLRTVFRKFWGLFEDHLMNIWGTFDDHRILTTLITYWGLWCRLEYLLWTSEDFEGFDDLLRNLRTFWGSVENLRSEDLGYLLCIFLTFWGLSGPFEEFWKTWGPDFLRTLKNLSGTFDDFLWTYWGPDAFEDFDDFSGHWGFCEPDYLLRTLRTLINFWGLWNRLEYLFWTYEDFEGFDNLLNLNLLRISWEPEVWGPWVPFVHFLDFLRTFWTLWGILEDLRTWCSQNVEESFRNFWWLLVNLLRTWCLWGLQWLFRTLRILRTWLPTEDFEDVDKFLRTLKSPWIPFVDLWGLRGLW